ncbi:MAG: ABC transporter permease, partial [Pseudomonadota bacterium]
MLSYVLRRVAQAVIVLLAVGLVAFSIFQFLGDPIDALLSVERTPEAEARARAELGLDQPPYTQYA